MGAGAAGSLTGAAELFRFWVFPDCTFLDISTAKGYDLYYWESNSTAELDFVLQKGNQIIGIEVKKGEHVRSRSLSVFVDSYKPAYSIRMSLKNFGEKDGLKSVPLYAAFCV